MNCNCEDKENCQENCETAETAETAKHIGLDVLVEIMSSCEKEDCTASSQEDCEECN